MKNIHYDFDYIIVGSGFGGSVSAMRLAQKGYKVAVIESGKRWSGKDFPKTNWNLKKYLWLPLLGFYGIQRINLLNDFLLVSGSGVGGGSLVYANTLYVPGEKYFSLPIVNKLGGKEGLLPFYDIAKHMLGVTENPKLWEPDEMLRLTAEEMGKGDTFRRTPVGIYFGDSDKENKDPYFMGEGPERRGCNFCGGCMVGCRFDAKNTLDKNYLYFAEKLGATIIPESKVISLKTLNEDGYTDKDADGKFGYEIITKKTTSLLGKPHVKYSARSVVLSAGVMGTMGILLKMKEEGFFKNTSNRLGDTVRTNSETVLPVTVFNKDVDYSRGIAITSSIHPDENTHIEPVRYSKGSDFFGLLGSVMTDGGGWVPRPLKYFYTMFRNPIYFLKAHWPFGLSDKSIILLVMQTLDNSVKIVRKRRWIWPFQKTITSQTGEGEKAPSYIPIANEFARRLAKRIGGIPRSSLNDVLLQAPVTGHIMGGAIIAESKEEGVIDLENKVYGYQNLRICDASMIMANLGVNPSLTITALSERAMSKIPKKEESQFFNFEKKLGFDKYLNSNTAS